MCHLEHVHQSTPVDPQGCSTSSHSVPPDVGPQMPHYLNTSSDADTGGAGLWSPRCSSSSLSKTSVFRLPHSPFLNAHRQQISGITGCCENTSAEKKNKYVPHLSLEPDVWKAPLTKKLPQIIHSFTTQETRSFHWKVMTLNWTSSQYCSELFLLCLWHTENPTKKTNTTTDFQTHPPKNVSESCILSEFVQLCDMAICKMFYRFNLVKPDRLIRVKAVTSCQGVAAYLGALSRKTESSKKAVSSSDIWWWRVERVGCSKNQHN